MSVSGRRVGLNVAGRRPTPADQPDRANRTAGVEVPYSGRPGRSWLATTRESPPSCHRRRSGSADGRTSMPNGRTAYGRWSPTCVQPTAVPPPADCRFLSTSIAVVLAVPVSGERFLRAGALPCTVRVRTAKAKHRAYAAQQSIEQSPVDAQKTRVAAARAPHAFPVRERQGAIGWRIRWMWLRHGERLFNNAWAAHQRV